ncbi:putative antibiotic transporter [Anaerohalosphaera lusitana]|uniref:UPF0056 membrane protein n=1 Tax=Anaerohalosphaera lusitana TaxID=1936003 RepID=A0A1U9NIX7_9BACT|nr:MarC family protein [Anaerohalosphaera lusitana]AQT67775.1 putative antibiotic transporter [Anaerohalosphaera lusitana]
MANQFVNTYLTIFFLLTPFFATSMFISLTQSFDGRGRMRMAAQTTAAALVVVLVMFLWGGSIFRVLGIDVYCFQIGAGVLLFLTAVSLVRGGKEDLKVAEGEDISLVPLAIPVIAGPGTIGTLVVMGSDISAAGRKAVAICAIVAAVLTVGVLLLTANRLEKLLGAKGLSALTKITGLVLSALAAQVVFGGVRNYLGMG